MVEQKNEIMGNFCLISIESAENCVNFAEKKIK